MLNGRPVPPITVLEQGGLTGINGRKRHALRRREILGIELCIWFGITVGISVVSFLMLKRLRGLIRLRFDRT